MARGLGKVGKPKTAADRFAAADVAMNQASSVDPYVQDAPQPTPAPTPPAIEPPTPRPATVKKTLTLTTSTLDDLNAVDRVLLRAGRKAKEVELVRAAIEHFAQQPDEVIVAAFDAVEKLQTGPRR